MLSLAALALLLGIQIPNFIDQYEKRLDAHLIEVQTNLRPFQEIANRFHDGSLDALIEHHERSPDPSFHAEGEAIRTLLSRYQRFTREQAQLQVNLPSQVVFIATRADRELIDETRRQYSFGLVLNRQAVVAGLVSMIGLVVVLELVAGLFHLFSRERPVLR